MADTIQSSRTLDLLAAFVDEDDRTISMPNAKASISAADITALETLAAPVLIGDKHQAAFTRFKEAKVVNKTVRKFGGLL